MATIGKIKLSATKSTDSDTSWVITAKYVAHFSAAEVTAKTHFSDRCVLMDDDNNPTDAFEFQGPDDKLATFKGQPFQATAQTIHRTFNAKVKSSVLNTDPNTIEELYAIIQLTNTDINLTLKKPGSILKLDPA